MSQSGRTNKLELGSLSLRYQQGFAVVVMDDGKVNALDNDWFRRFNAVLDAVEASDARGLILVGRPGVFSGGLNIKWLPGMDQQQAESFQHLFPTTCTRLYQLSLPTVAVLTGHAIAGGCILACACDRRVALSGDFNMAMNEVRIGMTAPDFAVSIVRSVVPLPLVNELFLYGGMLTFGEAQRAGVIAETVADVDDALAAAVAVLGRS